MRTSEQPLVGCLALAGPTASGKTAAALALARAFDIEVISMDSALVYCGMDIGTAKPDATERAAVPHHLIDIRDPVDPYSAAQFARDARHLIAEINARARIAVLVGGTMLYFKALQQGLHEMPSADATVRATLEREAREEGWPALHARLARLDPPTASRLQPQDGQRIQRALEVYLVSGRAMSSFHAEQRTGAPDAQAMPLLSLEPQDRQVLHERIALRFDAMLQAGLVGEVERLRARGDLSADLPSMRCVGYRQTWEALDGLWPMQELRDRGTAATRQLAKRQLTWLRSMPERHVLASDAPQLSERVLAIAGTLLQRDHVR